MGEGGKLEGDFGTGCEVFPCVALCCVSVGWK